MELGISFNKLMIDDLPLLHSWLLTEGVNEWYGKKGYSFSEIQEKYVPRITGAVPTKPYLILHKNKPIGYIQWYRVIDYPDYNSNIGADENTASIDLFIGENDFRHKGLGVLIIEQFLRDEVFSDQIKKCIIGPANTNHAAIRCYDKVGFRHTKTIQVEESQEYIMLLKKEQLKEI